MFLQDLTEPAKQFFPVWASPDVLATGGCDLQTGVHIFSSPWDPEISSRIDGACSIVSTGALVGLLLDVVRDYASGVHLSSSLAETRI